jgi:hypothetical protein
VLDWDAEGENVVPANTQIDLRYVPETAEDQSRAEKTAFSTSIQRFVLIPCEISRLGYRHRFRISDTVLFGRLAFGSAAVVCAAGTGLWKEVSGYL